MTRNRSFDQLFGLGARVSWLLLGAAMSLLADGAVARPPEVPGGAFQEVAKLTASDGAAGDEFGWRVDIDTNRVIVGAPHHSVLGPDSGAAYIFEQDAGGADAWGQVAKLTAPGGGPEEFFGWSVAVGGDTVLVGSPRSGVDNPGSAWIFEREPVTGAWEAVVELTAGEPGDNFGGSLAMEGDTALVGASSTEGPGGGDGAVYVYERDAGGPDAWGQVAELRLPIACTQDASACGIRSDHSFGGPVALDGDLAMAGGGGVSNGFAYVFHRAGGEPGAWRRVARPIPADFFGGMQFGSSLGLDGKTLLIGAFNDFEPDGASGSAYVFERDPDGPSPWTESTKLLAPDGEPDDWFGRSAALAGDLAVVGASQETRFDQPGYAWVFGRDAGGSDEWGAIAKLVASDAEGGDSFGRSAAISGGTVVLGAHRESGFGLYSGAAYVFERIPAAVRSGARESGSDVVQPRREALGPVESSLAGNSSPPPPPSAPFVLDDALRASSPEPGRMGSSLVPGPAFGITYRGEEPLCLELDRSCDGLELSVSGGEVSGGWRNVLCTGADRPIAGSVDGDRILVQCRLPEGWAGAGGSTDPCPVGFTWAWIIDLPLDGTMDMFQLDGIWNAWWDEMEYTRRDGPCPF